MTTTPKITYAHLLTEPNPKHVESLIKFFESGCQQRGTGGFGVKSNICRVHNSDDTAVNYYEKKTALKRCSTASARITTKTRNTGKTGRLVGLARDGISVSLEPGGQLETSIGILHKPEELSRIYGAFAAKSTPSSKNLVSDWSIMVTNRNPVTPTFPSIRRTVTRR